MKNTPGFRTGPTQVELSKHRRWLEAAGNFGFTKLGNCTIRGEKTKTQICFAVTAKRICAFVFAYAKCLFSRDADHIPFSTVFLTIYFCY